MIATPAKPTADVAEIRRALDLLPIPGAVVEIRALDTPTGRGKPVTVAGYFLDLDKAAQAAAALDARKPVGVYLPLNEVNPALLARSPNQLTEGLKTTTSDNDIIRRRWLPLDFDPKRPTGISASEDEHCSAEDAARNCAAWLSSMGWPAGILADSGNGAHLLQRIDLPNDETSAALVRDCIAAVAKRFTGDGVDVDLKVFNAARIWKLYGTTARKGHDMPDRPHRAARLVEVPELVEAVPVELLRALAAMGKRPEPARSSTNGNGQGQPFNHRLDVRRWLTDRGQGFKVKDRPDQHGREVYLLEQCPFDSAHGGSNEVAIYQSPDGALAAACMHNSCTGKGWQQFKVAIGNPDGNHYDPPYPDHQGNGQAHQGVAIDTTDQAAGDTLKPIEFRRITCAELDAASYDLEYLIDGALVARQPCILAGGKKTLKTSLLIDLGISLAMGGYFLGRLKVNRPARVGIMTGESGLGTIQETARRIATAAGHRLADIGGLVFSEDLPQFGSIAHQEALGRFIQADGLEVVPVDPAYMCIPDVDHANLFEVGMRLRGVSQVCQECGALLLLAHHTRKGKVDPFCPPELEDISWAGFQEFARQWLLVGRREKYQPGTGEHRLWLSAGGSAGHGDLWAVDIAEGTRATTGGRFWQVNVMPATEARHDADTRQEDAKRQRAEERAAATLESDRRELVKVAARLKIPQTKSDLRALAAIGHGRFDRAFASLAADGTLQPAEITKGNNRTFEAWKLRTEPDETKP